MNYLLAFDISGSGMSVEKLRLDVTAINLANINTTRSADGGLFKPLKVVTTSKLTPTFDASLNQLSVAGTVVADVIQADTPPRMVYDPGHPDADEKGFVAYPDINPVSEMINLITTTRAYEANVRAMNAAKTMALKALEIGGGS
jgi:flagellar basal-body rod protein FlgC